MSWQQRIEKGLIKRREACAYRHRSANQQGNHRIIKFEGRHYLNFSSNDYLGLSHHAQVIAAWQQGAADYGVGAGGSGHVTGFSQPHQQLESQLATWMGYPRALLFNSGYSANQALLMAMMQAEDCIIADKLCHASVLEAAMLSPAKLQRFQHNQVDSLAQLLAKAHCGERLVVTEGVFSMDGDSARLADLYLLAQKNRAWLMVDDAHGIGVCGEQGRGSCWLQGVRPEVLVITFGKAFGVSGAAVLCAEPLAEYLLQYARHLIYSTLMPPAQACAILAALCLVQQGDELRNRLTQHIAQFRSGIATLPFEKTASLSAIQPLIIGDNQQTLLLAQRLRDYGVWVSAIRPPTVPLGRARLRITLTAAHKPQDIEKLLEILHVASHEISR